MTPIELIDDPRRDGGFRHRLRCVRHGLLAGLLKPRGESVARGREFAERQLEQRVDLVFHVSVRACDPHSLPTRRVLIRLLGLLYATVYRSLIGPEKPTIFCNFPIVPDDGEVGDEGHPIFPVRCEALPCSRLWHGGNSAQLSATCTVQIFFSGPRDCGGPTIRPHHARKSQRHFSARESRRNCGSPATRDTSRACADSRPVNALACALSRRRNSHPESRPYEQPDCTQHGDPFERKVYPKKCGASKHRGKAKVDRRPRRPPGARPPSETG